MDTEPRNTPQPPGDFSRTHVSETDPPKITDFLENFFGRSIDSGLAGHITQVSSDTLDEFFALLAPFYDSYTLPAAIPGEARVYLNITSNDFVSIVENLVWAVGHKERDEFVSLWPQVYKYTLYCNEVCTLDPLSAISHYYRAYYREDARFTEETLRRMTSSAIAFVACAEPFIRRGFLHLIPYDISSDVWKHYCAHKDDIDAWILADAEYRKAYKKYWGYSEGEGYRTNSLYLNSRVLVAAAVDADFVGQSQWAADMYETLLRIGCTAVSQRSATARHFGAVVHSLNLPVLSGLAPAEFLSVREDEEAFAVWRADVGEVVRQCGDVDLLTPGGVESAAAEFNALASETFKKRQVELKRAIAASPSLGKHPKDGTLGFSAGWLAQFAQSGSIEGALTKAGLTATASFLLSILFRRPKKADAMLRRMYILMTEPADPSMNGVRII